MVAEIRPAWGRQVALPPGTRIAGAVHPTYCGGLRKQLIEWWVDVWPPKRSRGELRPLPPEARFSFWGKDLTQAVREGWDEVEAEIMLGSEVYEHVMELAPSAVVVWNDEYATYRGAALAAKDLNVPCVEICHGGIYLPRHGHASTKKYADFQLGSENYADFHKVMGLSGRAIPCGMIESDIYYGANVPLLRIAARSELRIPPSAPVVTFLTDAPFERSAWQDRGVAYRTVGAFGQAFKALKATLPSAHLIVKVHPYEQMKASAYGKILVEDLGIKEDYAVIEEPLATALAAADLVVGRPSSAMANALLLGVPCVVLAWEPFTPRAWYEGKGCALASDVNEMITAMLLFFLDEERAKELVIGTGAGAKYFAGEGNVARRMAKSIEAIIKGEM